MPSAEALAGIDFSSYRPGSLLGALFGGSDPVVFWNGDRSAFANLFLLPGAFIMLAMRVGALSCRTIANSVRIGTLLAAWVPLRLFATAHAQTYPPPSGIDADQDLNSRLGRVLDAYWAWAAYVISRCGVGFLNFARWCAEQDGLLPMSARRRFGELHELSTADHSWPEANETLRRSLGDDYWQVLYIPPVSQLSPMGDGAIEQTFAGAMLLPVEKDIRMDDSSRGGEVVHRQHVTEVLPIALRVRHRSLIRQMYQDLFFLRVLAAGRDLIGRIFPPALAQHISARRLLREFANETLLAVRYEDQAALVHRIGEHFSSHTSDDTSTEDELAKSGLEARIVDPDPQVMPLEVPRVILAHPLVTVTSLAKGIPLDRILALTPQGEDLLSDDEIAVGAHFSQSLLERIRNSGVEGIRKLKEAIARSIFAMTLRLTVYNGVYLSSFEPRSLLLHETDFDPKETSSKESKEEKANADALHTSLVAADFPHAARILSPQMHRKMIAALQCLYSGDSRGFAKALIDRHSEAYLKRSLSANSNLEASFILSLSPLLRLPADSSPAASKPGTVSRGYIPLPMALASVTQSARRSHIDLDPEIMAPLVALCRAQQLVAELAPQIDTCPKLAEAVQSAAFSLLPRRTNAVLQEPTNKHLRYT